MEIILILKAESQIIIEFHRKLLRGGGDEYAGQEE